MGKLNIQAWREIGASDIVLDWIANGVPINFTKLPDPIHQVNRVKGIHNELFVDAEIKRLLQQGAIEKTENAPRCVLPLKVVPKKNNKKRLILDCRYINSNISIPKFSQEGIESVAQQIQEGDHLISVDLENGFHHVEISKQS